MLLEQAYRWLGWPKPKQILDPTGAGAGVIVDFADRKIGVPLKRSFPGLRVRTGVLALSSESGSTPAPLAITCEFPAGARAEELKEAHRLAWNFSRAALLITLEPTRLMAWTCCQNPDQPEEVLRVCELQTGKEQPSMGSEHQRNVRNLLHWVSLISGHILREHPDRFAAGGRADSLLLKNLKHVRAQLIDSGLQEGFCHDLLARVLFTQFLFHRKDTLGKSYFSRQLLERRCNGALRALHTDLPSLLSDKEETYRLFHWLNSRFNGDLFPGSAWQSGEEREAAWRSEKAAVKTEHLRLLADLISGTIDTTDRQMKLWPQYSFDTIPLEFISSIYEEFLNENRNQNKAYYTPSFLVDYVLDAVLPWDGEDWNLRILDPACGSGIFLVKAFQRLIYRWRKAHDREPMVRDLKPLLVNNLFGVDINPEAVRVASFSLYLAMADAIEPRHYVTREEVFPRLRGISLVARDFFGEQSPEPHTQEDSDRFDLVIGNAPWGDASIRETSDPAPEEQSGRRRRARISLAERWAKSSGWPVSNNDIGPLFLAKGAELVRAAGHVAMVQPASLLYQRSTTAVELRRRLFSTYTFDEVTNLAAVRREIFSDVTGPACVLVFSKMTPSPGAVLRYYAPKPSGRSDAHQCFEIQPHDVSVIRHAEAENDAEIWSALAIGTRRDWRLIQKLSSFNTLAKLRDAGQIVSRVGVIPGDLKRRLPELRGRRYFCDSQFPDDVFLELQADSVPKWEDPRVHSRDSTSLEAFRSPQLLIKQSYSAPLGRFRAAIVRSSDPECGVICKKTYLSVKDSRKDASNIRSACVVYNSILACYFLGLSSNRLGHYRTEMLTKDLMTVPLPDEAPDLRKFGSFPEIDEETRRLFDLTEADWILVEDFLKYSLPDALRKSGGPGRNRTERCSKQDHREPQLSLYGQAFVDVMTSTFGEERSIGVTIYREPGQILVPVRMMTIHLEWPGDSGLSYEQIEADGLLDKLSSLYEEVLKGGGHKDSAGVLGFQRVAYVFHSHLMKTGRVPDLTIIKPDEQRYWTRSVAMQDADDLSSAILRAAERKDVEA